MGEVVGEILACEDRSRTNVSQHRGQWERSSPAAGLCVRASVMIASLAGLGRGVQPYRPGMPLRLRVPKGHELAWFGLLSEDCDEDFAGVDHVVDSDVFGGGVLVHHAGGHGDAGYAFGVEEIAVGTASALA